MSEDERTVLRNLKQTTGVYIENGNTEKKKKKKLFIRTQFLCSNSYKHS